MTAMTLPMTADALLQFSKPATAPANREEARPDAWSDEALIDAVVKRGSPQHFRTLLARYKVRVHQVALSVLGPSQAAQAEDVAQEVFISLYQRLDQFRGECKFSTWLYRLAINAAIDFKRSSARHAGIAFEEFAVPAMAHENKQEGSAGQFKGEIQQALNSLPESQRMMIYLYYWLDLKMREIAEVLDCPEGTVKVYLKRARASLAESLEGLKDD